MYFQKFPKTLYTLDDYKSAQLVTSILSRITFSEDLKTNLSIYDEYDIRDGETPEILADILYDNPELHWIILHLNDILDPRFEWPLPTHTLVSHLQQKYNNIYGIHHYEDNNGNYVNGNVTLISSNQFTQFNQGSVITNNDGAGNAFIISKTSNSEIIINVSDGGFVSGDEIFLASNASLRANVQSTVVNFGNPVTNYTFEDRENEKKRRIKVLKPQYIDAVIAEFNRKIESINE